MLAVRAAPRCRRVPIRATQPRRALSTAQLQANVGKLSHVWSARTSDVIVERAQGTWVWGVDGKKYLDWTCGIAVTNTGHCHPKVVKAIQEQAGNLLHGQANIVYHKKMLELVDRLQKIVKVSNDDRYFFSNSGAEAIEAAIKLARQVTHKPNIIAFQHSFHGRTIGTMSLSNSKYIYRIGFQPLMAGAFCSPYPYCLQCSGALLKSTQLILVDARKGTNGKDCCGYPMEQLELLVKQQTHPDEVAAVIVEPIPGEGGYVVPPKSFLKDLRAFCDKNKILLILDEVQTGFGRTGKWFAFEHFDVKPDILVMAKGIASGVPLSGIIASNELMGKWKPGSHGGTYGGNAVSCAAACATIDAMQEENMLQNTLERGKQLRDGLTALRKQYKQITDVRGLGLMVGLEFDHKANPGVAGKLSKACLNRNMLLLTAGAFETLRFIPPLNATREEIDLGLKTFSQAMGDVFGKA